MRTKDEIIEELLELLEDALLYVHEYFREKHNMDDDIQRIKEELKQ
jgi:hypothetical protein